MSTALQNNKNEKKQSLVDAAACSVYGRFHRGRSGASGASPTPGAINSLRSVCDSEAFLIVNDADIERCLGRGRARLISIAWRKPNPCTTLAGQMFLNIYRTP